MRASMTSAVPVAALVALAFACTDPVDKAAKQRIFSQEDPPKAVAAASEKLSPESLDATPSAARRILGMGAAETTERLGAHRFSAGVTFEWSAGQGDGKQLKLVEQRTLVAGPGGVSGDFHALIENSRDQGLEVLRVRGQVFAKSRYGKYRQRLRDRGMAEREREEVFGALRDIDELFQGRIRLTQSGSATFQGRNAWKYTVSLADAKDGPAAALPARAEPKQGADETTRRRLTFFDKGEPKALTGEVWVDAETAVVLKAKLDGRMQVASELGNAKLRLTLDSSLSDIGKDPGLRPPDVFLPDQDKPLGIADALDKFGIPRGGKPDAGVAPGVPEDEQGDDE